MPLQNRVTPFGEIVAVPDRGQFMGNRGIIHDPSSRTLLRRRWTTRAWIICVCSFRNVRRDVMARRSWTELFFFDEATALAAGHRPCFYCRRERARAFQSAWAVGNGDDAPPPAPAMDKVLHAQRLEAGGARRYHDLPGPIERLPGGTMIAAEGAAFLVRDGAVLRWSWQGYQPAAAPGNAVLLTPPATVLALRAGYLPSIGPMS